MDEPEDNQIDLGAVMELTGNDEIRGRFLSSLIVLNCEYPGCKEATCGLPQLRYEEVRFNRFDCYLCPHHNRCFYCKKSNADYYRVCQACVVNREERYRFRRLPPPLPNAMTDRIMIKLPLPRVIWHMICRKLNRIDQLMLAIACQAPWKRRAEYSNMARRHGTPEQTLWLLKQGCLSTKQIGHMVDYLDGCYPIGENRILVRRFHAAMNKKFGWNVMSKKNILGSAFVTEHDELVSHRDAAGSGLVDPWPLDRQYPFFKWNFSQLRSKRLSVGPDSSVLGLIFEFDEVDLLIWLKSNGCTDQMVTNDRIREAHARRRESLLTFLFNCDQKKTQDVLEKVFLIKYRSSDWDDIRFIFRCGMRFTDKLLGKIDWPVIETSFEGDQLSDGWTLFEILAELKLPLATACFQYLIRPNGKSSTHILRKFVQMGFTVPSTVMSTVIAWGIEDVFALFIGAGTRLTEKQVLSLIRTGRISMLKVASENGQTFGKSDMILAHVLDHPDIVAWFEETYKFEPEELT